jgi:nucleoside-triphosphatase THEP1
MIYILTGDIRTGKTTALLDWCENRNDVDGVLCPDDDIGKRYLLNIKSKVTYPLAAHSDTEEDNIVLIGPFQFLKSAFEKANDFLIALSTKKESQYLIIDELGKLELKHMGLHDSAEKLIPDYMFNDSDHLILVVRTSLLKEIIKHYEIKAYTLLAKEDLKTFV